MEDFKASGILLYHYDDGSVIKIGIELPTKFEKIDSKGIWNWEVVSSDNVCTTDSPKK